MEFEETPAPPSLLIWLKHTFLFFLTFCTATLAGAFFPFGSNISPLFLLETFFDDYWKILTIPSLLTYLTGLGVQILYYYPELLKQGLTFSIPLLAILTAHEFGHYIACRLYRVEATLPYFIPIPLLSPAGTFGAFIKILTPLPSRRATFDIGVAGPIAGFVVILPVLVIAFLTMTQISPEQLSNYETGLVFSDPLMLRLFAFLFGFDLHLAIPNGFYFAAWVGLLITSLNLVPAGQLDGGHTIFSVFGARIHKLTGQIAFVLMAMMTIVGWAVFGSPSGILFTVLLGVMLRIRHPEPLDDTPLDFKRKIIALITLIIFILSFVPFPIQIPA